MREELETFQELILKISILIQNLIHMHKRV